PSDDRVPMTNPFAVLWRSAANVYDELFPMVGMNLLWLLLSLPVVLVVWALFTLLHVPSDLAILLALVLALFGPNPAFLSIHRFANQLVKEERVEFELFWTGLRTYWRRGLVLLAISVAVIALLGVNIIFYLI